MDEPIKALVPQLTRTIKAADAMVQQLNGPVDRVAPGLSKLADVLNAPGLTTFPTELSDVHDDAHRTRPSGCNHSARWPRAPADCSAFVASSALRSTPSPGTSAIPPSVVEVTATEQSTPVKPTAKKATAKKSVAVKKAPAKKTPAKKTSAKKAAVKKAPAKKAAAKKSPTKKAAAKKR